MLTGIALTSGWWFLKMWQMYGNPVFPQFNDIFHGPMARDIGVVDTYFRPQNLIEYLCWPYVFLLNPQRLAELPMKLAVWAVAYTLMAVFIVVHLVRRWRGAGPRLEPRIGFLLLFFAAAYLCWMHLFSIYRYLIPLELIAPLVIWILWRHIAPSTQRIAGVVLAALVLGVFPVANWGRASWDGRVASAEVPTFEAPSSSIVFIAQPNPPMAWMATLYPAPVRFIAVDTGFPESEFYRQRMREAIRLPGGPAPIM